MINKMIRTDLITHFLAGFFIATVTNMFVIRFGDPAMIYIGMFAALAVGLGKELYDMRETYKETLCYYFNWADFLLTWLGGSLGMFVDLGKL